MTLAKALGNGLPIGAMLATNRVAEAFTPGSHASTFGGTPLVTAVACEVLKRINAPTFLERVRRVGAYFTERLRALQAKRPAWSVRSAPRAHRGRGARGPRKRSGATLPGVGIPHQCTVDKVLRFVPPLVVSEAEIDRLIQALDTVFAEMERSVTAPGSDSGADKGGGR